MGSNNNPETSNTGTPGTTTQVTIGDQRFELRNMSAQDGARLYAALPDDYKRRADAMASFIQNFRTPLADELPEELREPGRLEAFIGQLAQGAGSLPSTAPQWMKDLLQSAASNVPGSEAVNALVSFVRTTGSAIGFVGNTAREAIDWGLLTPRALASMVTRSSEWLNSTSTPPTREQALALASAYQAAMYMQTDSPLAPAESRRREAGTWDKITSRIEYWWSWLSSSAAGKYVRATWNVVANWVGGEGWDWTKAVQQAETSIAANSSPSYEQILEENLIEPARQAGRPRAEEILTNAGSVASLSTRPFIGITREGGYFAGHDGNVHRVAQGGEAVTTVRKPDGRPLSMAEVNQQRNNDVTGSIGTHGTTVAVAGATVGVPATVKIYQGAVEGFARHYRGEHNGAAARATKAEAKAQRLANQAFELRNHTLADPAHPNAHADRLEARSQRVLERAAPHAEIAERRAARSGILTRVAEGADTELWTRRGHTYQMPHPQHPERMVSVRGQGDGFWRGLGSSPRRLGRFMGNIGGHLTEPLLRRTDIWTHRFTDAIGDRIRNAPSIASEITRDVATGVERTVRNTAAAAIEQQGFLGMPREHAQVTRLGAEIAELQARRHSLQASLEEGNLTRRQVRWTQNSITSIDNTLNDTRRWGGFLADRSGLITRFEHSAQRVRTMMGDGTITPQQMERAGATFERTRSLRASSPSGHVNPAAAGSNGPVRPAPTSAANNGPTSQTHATGPANTPSPRPVRAAVSSAVDRVGSAARRFLSRPNTGGPAPSTAQLGTGAPAAANDTLGHGTPVTQGNLALQANPAQSPTRPVLPSAANDRFPTQRTNPANIPPVAANNVALTLEHPPLVARIPGAARISRVPVSGTGVLIGGTLAAPGIMSLFNRRDGESRLQALGRNYSQTTEHLTLDATGLRDFDRGDNLRAVANITQTTAFGLLPAPQMLDDHRLRTAAAAVTPEQLNTHRVLLQAGPGQQTGNERIDNLRTLMNLRAQGHTEARVLTADGFNHIQVMGPPVSGLRNTLRNLVPFHDHARNMPIDRMIDFELRRYIAEGGTPHGTNLAFNPTAVGAHLVQSIIDVIPGRGVATPYQPTDARLREIARLKQADPVANAERIANLALQYLEHNGTPERARFQFYRSQLVVDANAARELSAIPGMTAILDSNRNSRIDNSEIVAAVRHRHIADANQNGRIDAQDFRQHLQNVAAAHGISSEQLLQLGGARRQQLNTQQPAQPHNTADDIGAAIQRAAVEATQRAQAAQQRAQHQHAAVDVGRQMVARQVSIGAIGAVVPVDGHASPQVGNWFRNNLPSFLNF